jgi:cold shock CspA family protein/ribosome-associated translation inhibitor RaiA
MQIEPKITFRNMGPSKFVEDAVREHIRRLERVYPRLTSCRVAIELPHRHHRQGSHFRVRIDMTVPGAELVAARFPPQHASHEDPHVALRDAFLKARRELLDWSRRQNGHMKSHVGPAEGTIVQLSPEGFGFIATDDGRELYFHRNSVIDGWDSVDLGTRVRFAEEAGEKGPQASTVALAAQSAALPIVRRERK